MSIRQKLSACLILGGACGSLATAATAERIRLNQVGFAFGQPKLAVSLDSAANAEILDASGKVVYRTGELGSKKTWNTSAETGWRIDFSAFNSPGTFTLRVGSSVSHPFQISANPFEDVSKSSIKSFWYQRSSYAPAAPYAGQWARALGHADNAVVIHKSAASPGRDSGSTISTPGGWYDAGDYGKYVSNAGISTWMLLHLYETAPSYFDTLSLNVPASASSSSDLVNEILYEIRWLLTMQDPYDGGVYHSVTTQNFPGFVMPSADTPKRFVVQKSTTATLDFAAVTAYASRVFRNQASLKSFSDSCLKASLRALSWARDTTTRYDTFYINGTQKIKAYTNTQRFFQKDTVYRHYKPTIDHGDQYPDKLATDELFWAESELFLTTQQDSFATIDSLATRLSKLTSVGLPTWTGTMGLGQLSLLSNKSLLTGSLAAYKDFLDSSIAKTGTSYLITSYVDGKGKTKYDTISNNLYSMPALGMSWGSNGDAATRGLLLWKAWQVYGDTLYKNASLNILDYLLGRNATGYCFVTGHGSQSPMNIHHRPSAADGITDPIPGFLVGGPSNMASTSNDGLKYPSPASKAYLDNQNSFATNEVAINWNAPLAYLVGAWSAELAAHPSTRIASGHSAGTAAALRATARAGLVSASLPGQFLTGLELLDLNGKVLARTNGNASTLGVASPAPGLYLARATTASGKSAQARVLVP